VPNRAAEVFACLCVDDAAATIDFYVKAFGVREKFRLSEPNGASATPS
jgi:PhnB protein